MHIVRIAAAILAFSATFGCATVPSQPAAERRVGENPGIGENAGVRVGEPVYTKFDYRVLRVPRLIDGLSRSLFVHQVDVPAGITLEHGSRHRVDGWCTKEPYLRAAAGPDTVVCFTHPSDQEFRSIFVPGALGADLQRPVRFEWIDEFQQDQGFKIELVYQGVAGDILRLAYREYLENLARPAFHQDLTYTLNPTGEVTPILFRSLEMLVESADNSGIRYRVIRGLE